MVSRRSHYVDVCYSLIHSASLKLVKKSERRLHQTFSCSLKHLFIAFSDWPWFCFHSALDRHQASGLVWSRLSVCPSSGRLPMLCLVVPVWRVITSWCLPTLMHPKGMFPLGSASSSLQPRSGGKGCLCPGSLTPVRFQTHGNRRGEWPPFFCMNRFQLNAAPALRFIANTSLLSHPYEVHSCDRICWIGMPKHLFVHTLSFKAVRALKP